MHPWCDVYFLFRCKYIHERLLLSQQAWLYIRCLRGIIYSMFLFCIWIQPQCRPVHRGRPAHTQRMVQLPEVHPRTGRPTERTPRAQNTDAKSRGTRDNAVRLRHVEPARVPLRHAAPSSPRVLDSLHRLAKAQQLRRPPDFLSEHAYQDGK